MPNHVRNRITVSGDQFTIDEFKDRFSTHYEESQSSSFDDELTFEKDGNYGWLGKDGSFRYQDTNGEIIKADAILDGYKPRMEAAWTRFPDFNKIVQMPQELEETTSDGLVMYLENQFTVNSPVKELLATIKKSPESAIENFCKAVKNISKYGHSTWYPWAHENWGTKWNAYDCKEIGGNVFEFDTAWSGVVKLVSKMAESFPTLRIIYEYADEDTSYKCAVYVFEGGEQVDSTVFEEGSKEAYEHAFKLRPEYAEDYVLVGDNYECKES